MKQGFSLIELSVVLAILGLLAGGIMVGQQLLRNSELGAVITEQQRYYGAMQAFRTKYGQLPGDLNTATTFWGDNASLCASASVVDGNPGVCNGNGNGLMQNVAATAPYESFQVWTQLSLAGFIEGGYTGSNLGGGAGNSVIGSNIPKSRLTLAGWGAYANFVASTAMYSITTNNTLFIGRASSNSYNIGASLRPQEAWSIDTKQDDGKPGQGRVIARENGLFGSTNSCTTSTGNTDFTGSYKLDNDNLICMLLFIQLFQ